MKTLIRSLFVLGIVFSTAAATAQETDGGASSSKGVFKLDATIGESLYVLEGEAYRGPVSFELVPSFGWEYFRIDLGLGTTLESIEIGGTHVGEWAFLFRPGARLTAPILPMYLRFAVPLYLQQHNTDWGFLFGLGVDIPLIGIVGLVLEADTTLTSDLEWGGVGVPVELRAGVSFRF